MKKLLLGIILIFFPLIASAQDEVLTNQSITDMLELGFSNDVIVTKINTSKNNFDTSIQALKELKEKGVSNDIIVAMMQKNNDTEKQIKKTPRSGIYFKVGSELKKIYPTAFSGTKTSTLGTALTYGIADAKIKSTMNGKHSNNIINTNIPSFYFYFDDKEQNSFAVSNWWFTVASSPNEFLLSKLTIKKNRRELETGKVNIYAGNSIGVDEDKTIGFEIETMNDYEFKVTPSVPLLPGEYCFFYRGTIPQGGYNNQAVFDFSISESCKIETKYKNGDYVWILKDSKPRNYQIISTEIRRDGVYYILQQRNSWEPLEYKESDCYSSKEEATNK